MKILLPVLLVLFSSWMLWGWVVGESRNLKWMRNWCATLFVISALIISSGGGAVVAWKMSESRHRAAAKRFAVAIETRLRKGETDEVLEELSQVIEPPDEWSGGSPDVLDRVDTATSKLADSGAAEQAQRH